MLEVVTPGLLATIQDGGRPGLAHLGVPRSGACDPWSLAVSNLLLGNPPDAPALEITFGAMELDVLETCAVGLAGADLGAVATGGSERRLATGRVHRLVGGERVRFGGGRRGLRTYLSLAGGIVAPRVLGSVSPLAWRDAGRDGDTGRASDTRPRGDAAGGRRLGLGAGDRLVPVRRGDLTAVGRAWPGSQLPPPPTEPPDPAETATPDPTETATRDAAARASDGDDEEPILVEVVAGPDADRFEPAALESLVTRPWTVAPDSDRMGLRLRGPGLRVADVAEHLSVGMTWGAIQVPADGLPIALLADHQTVGGYPVLAVVATADRPALGQLRPGDRVRFRLASVEAVQARWREAVASLRRAAEALDHDAAWDTLSLDARG